MRYNLMFPMRAVKHWQRWRMGATLQDVARTVEEAGFDGFSMSDHPYPDKQWLSTGGHHAFDPFVSLSMAAAATQRMTVMTYILVAGYRNPYLTAKAAASLDTLTEGRFILGTGAGYLESEFSALGGNFRRRGVLLDEAIDAWKSTWTGRDHHGLEFAVTGHEALPLPKTPGGPPVWIGGNSKAAQRRVVDIADGWMPIPVNPQLAAITGTAPLEDIATLTDWIGGLNSRRREVNRGPADVAIIPFESNLLSTRGAEAFCAELARNIDAYAEAGVTWLTIEPASRSFDEFRADIELLASHILRR